MNLSKSNYQTHFFFLSLIVIHYLISIIFVGQVIVEPHDYLDTVVVNDHIISKIYNGDIHSIDYFLGGTIKWYFLEKIFYPTNILHFILSDKLFYFTNDVLKKIFAYYSFYILAKSLSISKFKSAFGAILYSTIVYNKMNMGLAIPFLPYILYLLLNKNTLNTKHYIFLIFIGLNSSLIQDVFAFIFLIPLSYLLNHKTKNLRVYLQTFFIIFISSVLSNIHLVIGSILASPIHREDWVISEEKISPIIRSFQDFFIYADPQNALFIFYIPLAILTSLIFILCVFNKNKKIRLILFFIIFILFLKSFLHRIYIDNFLIGFLEILQGYNFQRVDRIIPVAFALLFVFFISNIENRSLKKLIYVLSFFSILLMQLKTPVPVLSQYFLKENMQIEKFEKAKESFLEKRYITFLKYIFNTKNYDYKKNDFNNSTNKTFDNYYKFKDYAFLKNFIKDARVMSVGLDPMIAVMNDIKVIDGYHNIYPLAYKIKFREIIKNELDKNIELKNYYDNWGSRVYAFYNDQNNILLDFKAAKKMGANFVISKFPIKNNSLKIICYKCNNSKNIFLYKIL